MNDFVKKWVEALRSGEYLQTQKTLKSPVDNGYCCLGVACDISGLGRWSGADYVITYGPYLAGRIWSDDPVGRMTGLTDLQISELISLNDTGVPFEGIARAIEGMTK